MHYSMSIPKIPHHSAASSRRRDFCRPRFHGYRRYGSRHDDGNRGRVVTMEVTRIAGNQHRLVAVHYVSSLTESGFPSEKW